MAMEATHIRFALDLADILKPENLDAYIAGSVYPDSRYVSKIDRFATHPEDYLQELNFRSSDFKKGWLAHLLCDDVQYMLMGEMLPIVNEGTRGQNSETWIKRTAVKVLQDMEDVKKYDLAKYLPALSHLETPNGEKEDVMRSYHALIQKAYANTPDISISDEMHVWANFGIGDELVSEITKTALAYESSEEIMRQIRALFSASLAKARGML